jgi:hypothetical protein
MPSSSKRAPAVHIRGRKISWEATDMHLSSQCLEYCICHYVSTRWDHLIRLFMAGANDGFHMPLPRFHSGGVIVPPADGAQHAW